MFHRCAMREATAQLPLWSNQVIELDFDKEVKVALLPRIGKSLQFSVEVVVVFSFIGIGYLV